MSSDGSFCVVKLSTHLDPYNSKIDNVGIKVPLKNSDGPFAGRTHAIAPETVPTEEVSTSHAIVVNSN